jgi:hypothetical protein
MAIGESVDDMIITVSFTSREIHLIYESVYATIALIGGRGFSNTEVDVEELQKIKNSLINVLSISKFERYKTNFLNAEGEK